MATLRRARRRATSPAVRGCSRWRCSCSAPATACAIPGPPTSRASCWSPSRCSKAGDWWFPHRGQELYPDKPPLFFWLLAACTRAARQLALELPAAFAAVGPGHAVAGATTSAAGSWNHRAGLWAAIAVLAALQFVYQFKRAQIDPTLVLATTLSLYGMCRHLLLGPHWRWYWIGCFFAGLGVILKGVGFLPLLVLLPYALMRRARWRGPGGTRAAATAGAGPRGALAFLAAIALWLAPMLYDRARRRRSRASRLPRQPAVQADRDPLRRRLAPPQAVLVFRAA